MNEDDLARLLRSIPDEPALPADPVNAVGRRETVLKRRRRALTGALVLAVLGATGGVAVTVTGPRSTGSSFAVHEATMPPSPTVTASPAGPTTPTSASPTATATAARTASAPVVVAPPTSAVPTVRFTWDTQVFGNVVRVGGTWAGTAPRLLAVTVPGSADRDAEPGAVVSHVDWDFGGGSALSDPYDVDGDFSITSTLDRGDNAEGAIGTCDHGPEVAVDDPTVTPYWLHFPRAGTYTLRMSSETCVGEVTSSTTVQVGAVDPFSVSFGPHAASYPEGTPATLTVDATGPLASLPFTYSVTRPGGYTVSYPSDVMDESCAVAPQHTSSGSFTVANAAEGPMVGPQIGTWVITAYLVCGDRGSAPIEIGSTSYTVTAAPSSMPAPSPTSSG